ncbi:hypothetical protein CHS0354_006847 [Potamilus streckersoni]|uniref:Glycine dehydrogenase (aminomethyl-transferring) n=1 Tax=Potamilus streckersoni TaxID=2493646 RepID=A0AAE0WBS5_9BIVA|nr:hypothetical protein CHS0354_006847 [Potamilus streckersoni]
METANASLLDEATAAAEAMTMAYRLVNRRQSNLRKKVFVSGKLYPVNKALLESRAEPLEIEIVEGDLRRTEPTDEYCCTVGDYGVNVRCIPWAEWVASYRRTDSQPYTSSGKCTEICRDKPLNEYYFDTLTLQSDHGAVRLRALEKHYNLRYNPDGTISVSLDETTSDIDLNTLLYVLTGKSVNLPEANTAVNIPCTRQSAYMTHPVFSLYHSETDMMRYIKSLENKDLSLTMSMIPLGSCTMKLNPASAMLPLLHPNLTEIHPFAPREQALGYAEMIESLEKYLAEITGFDAVSLQPNSGAQGEYAGLKAVRDYHLANGDMRRNIAVIPESAHGTNPASASMCGMEIVTVKTQSNGNIDIADLQSKLRQHAETVAVLMVTYPSTYGVFEPEIKRVCDLVHQYGGQVYMDGRKHECAGRVDLAGTDWGGCLPSQSAQNIQYPRTAGADRVSVRYVSKHIC